MKPIAPLLLCTLMFAGAARAETRPNPIIVCDEPEHCFGAVTNDRVIIHEFTLSNEGDFPLFIRAVRTDCGCVASRLADDTLAPGKSAQLKVIFDLKKRSGRQFRRIIVESNDPQTPRLILAVFGEAIAPVEIVPDQLWWGNLHSSASNALACEINFSEGDQAYITAAASPSPLFEAGLSVIRPRRKYTLTVRAKPPLQMGEVPSPIMLTTDHPRYRTLEIPMRGRIVGDIYSIPGEIVLAPANGGAVSRSFLVYSGIKRKFKILKVDVPDPAIEARTRPMSGSSGYRVDLRNLRPVPGLDGKQIAVTTDCESTPVLNIPLRLQANGAR